MPKSLQTFLLALTAALLLALPARGVDQPPGNPCLTLDQRGAEKVLSDLSRLAAPRAKFASVSLRGLSRIGEEPLWTAIGDRPELPMSLEAAAALAARLDSTGLFAKVAQRIDGDAFIVDLTENPVISTVEIRGLGELFVDDVLGRLLRAPFASSLKARQWDDDDEDGDDARGRSRRSRRARCFTPDPPREWLAHVENGAVKPGILWEGLSAALERIASQLRSEGYALASFTGELTADGALVIDVDEGRLEGLDVAGVHPSIRRDVIRELGLRPGDPFSMAALRAGMQRVRHRFPFLHANGPLRLAGGADRVVIEDAGGAVRFRSVPPAPDSRGDPARRAARRASKWSWDWSWDDDDEDDDDARPPARFSLRRDRDRRRRAVEIDGRRLRLHLRADRTSVTGDPVELIRHTQVTGFAPGLQLSLRFWDPGDRAHLSLDGLFQINSKRSGHAAEGDLWERIGASERVDWLVGARLQIPALALAELGAQLHTLTDTEDRWRVSRLDSYLWSFLANRPESEWFRRTGATAFATLHVAEKLTLGVEGRVDRYASLDPIRVPVLFHRDEAAYPNPAVDAGLMTSAVFRLEWSSDPLQAHKLGNVWRSPSSSLLPRDAQEPGLRTLATVEVGTHALGGEMSFVKLVSDTTLLLEIDRRQTLRLRARVAGGRDLPLQKQEALGGWEALRGYDFKELRGDWSALGTLEWSFDPWGLFADVGSVHQPGRWVDPNLGVGALFHIGDVRFEAAWRTDQRARLTPEMRLLFTRTF